MKIIEKSKKFLENLRSYGVGTALRRMGDKQYEVVRAVRETGLAGKLKITLTYDRVGSNGIKVKTAIKATIPERPIPSVEMFADDKEGFLHEENPDQMTFDDEELNLVPTSKKINELN